MRKRSDWERRLHEFLTENKLRPFRWGEWDCCIFTNAAVYAMTGEHLIPKELEWHDESSAQEAIKSYGKTLGKSIYRASLAKGLIKVPANAVRKGDVLVIREDGKQVAAICDGSAALSPSDGGFTFRSLNLVQMGFRIDG